MLASVLLLVTWLLVFTVSEARRQRQRRKRREQTETRGEGGTAL